MLGYYFTYFVALLGLGYGWLNPFFGLMVYYLFAVIRPQSLWFWAFSQNDTRFSLYVGLATLVGWIFKGTGTWSIFRYVWLPMVGLLLYLAGTAIGWSLSPVFNSRASEHFTVQYKIVVMAFVAITLITTPKRIQAFAWVLTAGLGYLAWNFNVQYLDNPYYLLFRGFGGIDNNGVAMVMAMSVPLCFFMGLNAPTKWWGILIKVGCFVGAACMVHVVLFSFSRGGMLGLIMVAIILFIVAMVSLPNKLLTLFLAILGVIVALRLAGEGVRAEFMTIFVGENNLDKSAASRFITWGAAWRCMKDYPLGVGPRGFNILAPRYGLGLGKSVHNLFLQTGADSGFLGLFGLILFYTGTMWKVWRSTLTRTAKRMVWPVYFGHMCIISLISFCTSSQFVGMESVESGYLVAILGLATAGYVYHVAASEQVTETGVLPELEQVPDEKELENYLPAM
ncbi:MAG: hypothetical protein GC164_15340 [Phycisphaera sp.]|nr:hypothetical protein [Phycisphaera sp.]